MFLGLAAVGVPWLSTASMQREAGNTSVACDTSLGVNGGQSMHLAPRSRTRGIRRQTSGTTGRVRACCKMNEPRGCLGWRTHTHTLHRPVQAIPGRPALMKTSKPTTIPAPGRRKNGIDNDKLDRGARARSARSIDDAVATAWQIDCAIQYPEHRRAYDTCWQINSRGVFMARLNEEADRERRAPRTDARRRERLPLPDGPQQQFQAKGASEGATVI